MKYLTFLAVANFLLYAGVGMGLLALFARLYVWWTPYNEFDQMRRNKKAPAFALGGAMLGFTFPLLSLSVHGVNLVDYMVWSVVAGGVQLVLFKVLYGFMPMEVVDEENQAVGIFYGFAAVCVGLINAFSLIPS